MNSLAYDVQSADIYQKNEKDEFTIFWILDVYLMAS